MGNISAFICSHFWTEEDTRASLSAISMTAKSQAITLDGTVPTRRRKWHVVRKCNSKVSEKEILWPDKVLFFQSTNVSGYKLNPRIKVYCGQIPTTDFSASHNLDFSFQGKRFLWKDK